MYPHERLKVWQRAQRLAVSVLAERALSSPGAQADLGSQLRRAVMSISANIAEGAGSASPRVFARYLGIALASAKEAHVLLCAGADAGVVERERAAGWIAELAHIRPMLFVLRRQVLFNADGPRCRANHQGAAP